MKLQDWLALFDKARTRIDLLTTSASFLLGDSQMSGLLERKCAEGVRIKRRGGTLELVQSLLRFDAFQLRLHRDVVYGSLYRADDDLIVNQHTYGFSAAESPVFHYRRSESSEIFNAYEMSPEMIWQLASVVLQD